MALDAKKKTQKDLESVFSELSFVWLSREERKEISSKTTAVKEGACFGVDLRSPLGTVFGGLRTSTKGYYFHLSDYPFYRIVYTVSGHPVIKISKKEYAVEPCSVYYFAPRESGYIFNDSDEPWSHIYVHFTGTKAAQMFKKIAESSDRVLHISDPSEIQYLFERIAYNCAEQHENSQAICDSYLNVLLLQLGSQAAQLSTHLKPSHITYQQCHNYIKNNFNAIISLDDVAQGCHINKIYLCRLFKQYANTSPMAYIMKLKMNKAAMLLIQTDYSIKQISLMLRFKNQYHFSRLFKQKYGISPKHFRENH